MSTFDEQEPRHDLRAVPDEHHPSPDEGVEQLEREAAATRAELGETVDALAAKLDVKRRAKHGADEQKARVQHAVANVRRSATDREGKPLPQVWAAGVAAAVALVGLPLAVRLVRSRGRRLHRYRGYRL